MVSFEKTTVPKFVKIVAWGCTLVPSKNLAFIEHHITDIVIVVKGTILGWHLVLGSTFFLLFTDP